MKQRRRKGQGGATYDKARKRWVVSVNFGKKSDGRPDIKTGVVSKPGQIEKKIDDIKNARALLLAKTGGFALHRSRDFHQTMAFGALMDAFLAAHTDDAWGTNHHRKWVRKLARPLDKLPVDQLNFGEIKRLLAAEHKRGLSTPSCQRIAEFIRAVTNFGWMDHGLIFQPIKWKDTIPGARGQKVQTKEIKTLESDEIAKLQASADKDPDFGSLIHTMLAVGARPGELFGATWAAVDWNSDGKGAGKIEIRKQAQPVELANGKTTFRLKVPKWSSKRGVDLPADVMVRLRWHRDNQVKMEPIRRATAGTRWKGDKYKRAGGLIWPSSVGSIMTPSNWMKKHWYPTIERTGIPFKLDHECHEPGGIKAPGRHRDCEYVIPYSMRHTSLSQQLNQREDGTAGSTVEAVMRVSGHKNPTTLYGYLKPTREQIAHSLRQVGRIAGMAPKFVPPTAPSVTQAKPPRRSAADALRTRRAG